MDGRSSVGYVGSTNLKLTSRIQIKQSGVLIISVKNITLKKKMMIKRWIILNSTP